MGILCVLMRRQVKEITMRITVKDLKKFLEDKDDNLDVYVDAYENIHRKEILFVRDYEKNSKIEDFEIVVSKTPDTPDTVL